MNIDDNNEMLAWIHAASAQVVEGAWIVVG